MFIDSEKLAIEVDALVKGADEVYKLFSSTKSVNASLQEQVDLLSERNRLLHQAVRIHNNEIALRAKEAAIRPNYMPQPRSRIISENARPISIDPNLIASAMARGKTRYEEVQQIKRDFPEKPPPPPADPRQRRCTNRGRAARCTWQGSA